MLIQPRSEPSQLIRRSELQAGRNFFHRPGRRTLSSKLRIRRRHAEGLRTPEGFDPSSITNGVLSRRLFSKVFFSPVLGCRSAEFGSFFQRFRASHFSLRAIAGFCNLWLRFKTCASVLANVSAIKFDFARRIGVLHNVVKFHESPPEFCRNLNAKYFL